MAEPITSRPNEEPVDEARRAALRQMGRYAAYTTPAMTALLISNRADAAVSGRGCRGLNQGTSGKCSSPNPAFGHNQNPVFGQLNKAKKKGK